VNTALLMSVPLALAATLTVYVTVTLPLTAMLGVPEQVIVCPEAVQTSELLPAVCALNVRPLGNVSVNVNVPLVAEPPLFSISRL
jgi:hypothetical protein